MKEKVGERYSRIGKEGCHLALRKNHARPAPRTTRREKRKDIAADEEGSEDQKEEKIAEGGGRGIRLSSF